MWVASFLRLILASRYQVGEWPNEVFLRSQTGQPALARQVSQLAGQVSHLARQVSQLPDPRQTVDLCSSAPDPGFAGIPGNRRLDRFRDRVYRPLYRTFHFANDRPSRGPISGFPCTTPHETVKNDPTNGNRATFSGFRGQHRG